MSPFNIQDEFHLPNFTHQQVQELLAQYTDEVGQAFAPEVIDTLHRQTAGQPFLVNRCAQILAEEMDIPKSEPITMEHFSKTHAQLLQEENANITHLLTNIRRDPRFERVLMKITAYESGTPFNMDNGIISKSREGLCEIANPIYQHRIVRAFQPLIIVKPVIIYTFL